MATSVSPAERPAHLHDGRYEVTSTSDVRPFYLTVVDAAFITFAVLVSSLTVALWTGRDGLQVVQPASYRGLWLAFIAVSALALLLTRLREPAPPGTAVAWTRTAGAVSFASMCCIVLVFLFNPIEHALPVLAMAWGLSMLLLPPLEMAAISVAKRISPAHDSVIVVGSPDTIPAALRQFEVNRRKWHVAGLVSLSNAPSSVQPAANVADLGRLDTLPEMVRFHANRNGGVVVAMPADTYSDVQAMISSELMREPRVAVALYPAPAVEGETYTVAHPSGTGPRRSSWSYETLKRAVDIVIAAVSLLVAFPLVALIALLIKLDSPGPVFFSQVRVGRNGRLFNMYKFRSMRQDAESLLTELQAQNEAVGHMFKLSDDPRVTRVGRIIRRLSLDELPQLFNVLNGTMSIVGPRPPLPREVENYDALHFRRFEALPGITGLWQIKRGPQISFDEMIGLDVEYIDHWSLPRDLWIMLMTVPAMLRGQGAY